MSDSNQKDPGRFGEDGAAVIQVTPGQIVGAALFLLVAAAIIFFAGMFARGLTMSKTEEAPAPPPPAPLELENVAVLPAPDPVVPEADPEPTPPKPTEEKKPPAKPAPEPEPEPAPEVVKTAPPVLEMKPVKAEAEEPEPVEEPAPPEPEPEPEPEPPAPAPKESTPPPAETKPEPLPELPPSTSGPFTVQVMSIGVAKRAQAEAYQRDALENKDVQVSLVDSSDGKLIRAYVGSYASRAEAEKARAALVRAGFDGCFIKQRED